MPSDYFPLLVMLVVASGFAAIGLLVSALAGPHRPTPATLQTYDSGMPTGSVNDVISRWLCASAR